MQRCFYLLRPLLIAFLSAMMVGLVSPFAVANTQEGIARLPDGVLQTWAGRIHIAGRQRMLSQRMTKAMCYSLLDTETGKFAQIADVAAREFEQRLQSLMARPMPTTRDPQLIDQIDKSLKAVEAQSRGLTASVRQIASGDVHSVAMRLVLERNRPTLKSMEKSMALMVKAAESEMAPKAARTLNQAGRQRALVQKMAKDICLISTGLHVTKSRVALKHDYTYFVAVHEALMSRTKAPHFETAPTPEIRAALRKVDGLWQRMKPLVRSVLDGEVPSAKRLDAVSIVSNEILSQMDHVVMLWAKHHS